MCKPSLAVPVFPTPLPSFSVFFSTMSRSENLKYCVSKCHGAYKIHVSPALSGILNQQLQSMDHLMAAEDDFSITCLQITHEDTLMKDHVF